MHQNTRELPYGKRRLLEMAIALACEPKVLLLDEPMAGVPSGERAELMHTLSSLPTDVSVLLIEHDMDLVFDLFPRLKERLDGEWAVVPLAFVEQSGALLLHDPGGDIASRLEQALGYRLPDDYFARYVASFVEALE